MNALLLNKDDQVKVILLCTFTVHNNNLVSATILTPYIIAGLTTVF